VAAAGEIVAGSEDSDTDPPGDVNYLLLAPTSSARRYYFPADSGNPCLEFEMRRRACY
jgi:hypothetical protein